MAVKKAQQENSKGAAGLMFCRQCGIPYFKKAWRHTLDLGQHLDKHDAPIKFVLCPACKLIADHQFEGEIRIFNIPLKQLDDMTHLVHNMGELAWKKDPLDRVIEIKHFTHEIHVTTTENQLAQKIAKKIKETFKPAYYKISKERAPNDVRTIEIRFEQSS